MFQNSRSTKMFTAVLVILLLVVGFGLAPVHADSGWQGPSFEEPTIPGEKLMQGNSWALYDLPAGVYWLKDYDNDPKWKSCNPPTMELGHAFYLNGQIDEVPWTQTECPLDPPDNEFRWKRIEFEGGTITFDQREDSHSGALYVEQTFSEDGSVEVTKIDQDGNAWNGVTVYLRNANGSIIDTKTTPAYFGNLEIGSTYTVEEVPPAGSVPMGETSHTFTVTAEHLAFSFQFQNERLNGGVEVTKIDQDGNAWNGVTVYLRNANGSIIDTKTTPAYFGNLEIGSTYTVEEVPPAGSVPMGETSHTFTVTAEHLAFSFQFQNERPQGEPTVCLGLQVNGDLVKVTVANPAEANLIRVYNTLTGEMLAELTVNSGAVEATISGAADMHLHALVIDVDGNVQPLENVCTYSPSDTPSEKAGLHFSKTLIGVTCNAVMEMYNHYATGGQGWEGQYLVEYGYLGELVLSNGEPFAYDCAVYGGPEAELDFLVPYFTAHVASEDGLAIYEEHKATTGRYGEGGFLFWDHTGTRFSIVPVQGEFEDVPVPGSSVLNPWIWLANHLGVDYNISTDRLNCGALPSLPTGSTGGWWTSVDCGTFINSLPDTTVETPPAEEPPSWGLGTPAGQMVWSNNHVGTIGLNGFNLSIIEVEGSMTSEWGKAGLRRDRNLIGVHNMPGNTGKENPGEQLLAHKVGEQITVTLDGTTSVYTVTAIDTVARGSDWANRLDQIQAQGDLQVFTCSGYNAATGLFETFTVYTLTATGS